MPNTEKQSFIRWQGRSIEQLGFVNYLLIFIATGILAFQVQLAVGDESFTILNRSIIILSMLLIFISLMLGCRLAWNRLRAFWKTAQVARKRETRKREGIENLRDEVNTLDKWTWWLLRAQTVSFVLGAAFLVIFAIGHFISC